MTLSVRIDDEPSKNSNDEWLILNIIVHVSAIYNIKIVIKG